MTRTALILTLYEKAQADAGKYEKRGDVISAADIYSRAGEDANRQGKILASYMCLNKAAELTDQALKEPRSEGDMLKLLKDSARRHFFAGMTAARMYERKNRYTMPEDESELWWARAVGHFADYKAAMRKLQGREGVSHRRELHANGLKMLNDPHIANILQLEWLEPRQQTETRRPLLAKTGPQWTILRDGKKPAPKKEE